MQSKSTAPGAENKICMLELQAKQVLNAVQRRVVVINAFPNNKLNPLYWQKIEQAMTFYG
ncbi:hypothetical protein QNI16_17570 [Cytophagaceae bacterium YF14B1]|uniref:Uncharacterized protein n=1 Tax=Xanthocytophaga flava TaxID=3048013 RepID=A0AAE3QT13_9BACT|nr:hypothetical protein [Xanthocytophaga flavus]MDJ1482319.1 hypothetical protein [Xanthocytophaga flavus]